jgi:hypothetical protein
MKLVVVNFAFAENEHQLSWQSVPLARGHQRSNHGFGAGLIGIYPQLLVLVVAGQMAASSSHRYRVGVLTPTLILFLKLVFADFILERSIY